MISFKQFLKESNEDVYKELGLQINMISGNTWMKFYKDGAIQVDLIIKGNDWWLKFIGVPPEYRRKGLASRFLKELFSVADKHNATITGTAKPVGYGKTSTEELYELYDKAGFDRKGDRLIRYPNGEKPKPKAIEHVGLSRDELSKYEWHVYKGNKAISGWDYWEDALDDVEESAGVYGEEWSDIIYDMENHDFYSGNDEEIEDGVNKFLDEKAPEYRIHKKPSDFEVGDVIKLKGFNRQH